MTRHSYCTQRMGILAGTTRHFNISSKKRLTDPFDSFIEGGRVSRSMQAWIEQQPLLIYRKVYKEGQLELAKDSHRLLMEKLKHHYPDCYKVIQDRRRSYFKK